MLHTIDLAPSPARGAPWTALAAIMDEAPDLIRVSDGEGVTVFASAASIELLGFSPQELVGSDVDALDHPDDRCSWALGQVEARRSGRPVRHVHRVQHRDGCYRWLETTARVLPRDGDRTYTVVISRDATGLQELARSGRPTRERLTALVEAMPDPVVLIDAEGRIVAATSTWLALVAHPGRSVGEPVDAVCRWRFGAGRGSPRRARRKASSPHAGQ